MQDIVHAEKSCKKIMSDITKRQLSGIAACGKVLKLSGKDKSKKMNVSKINQIISLRNENVV